MIWSKLTRPSSTPFGFCCLLGVGEGAAVVGGGLLCRVEQLSLSETDSPEDRPGLCGGILGVLRSVEGVFRNAVPGGKCSNYQGTKATSTAWCLLRPTQVDLGIRAIPPPILGDFGRVESGVWVILLIRHTLFWVLAYLWFWVDIGG
jgi:hypothetical protein